MTAVGESVGEREGTGDSVMVATGSFVQVGKGVFSKGWKGVAVGIVLGVTSTNPVVDCGSVEIMLVVGAQELIKSKTTDASR